MSVKKDGIMVILSSPSGAGKTTLVKLLSKDKNFHISISHTTRKARPSEVADKFNIDLNLRPQNLEPEIYFKLVKEYENLRR